MAGSQGPPQDHSSPRDSTQAPPSRLPPPPPGVAELPTHNEDQPVPPNTDEKTSQAYENLGMEAAGSNSGPAPAYTPMDENSEGLQMFRTNTLNLQSSHDSDSFPHDEPPPQHPPPPYSETPGRLRDDTNDLGANAFVADDGRVNIRINQKDHRISQLFAPQLRRQLTQIEHEPAPPAPYIPVSLGGEPGQEPPPPMNLVIHVVGSRGDVQPFVALGKVLKETYGHRVRLATHPTFKQFVTENGLEFFSIGGDPAELMAFMVKNPGLMPGFDTLRSGDVGKRRRGIAEILRGTWRSCIETGDGLTVDALKQSVEEWMGAEDDTPDALKKPFVADAIIANPPSFGHIHCAEKLGIPLHMMFTMPWSPTQAFPHPLANIQSSNADSSVTNFMSYALVDMLTWQGLGDIINKFRRDSLGLEPISMMWAPGMLARLKVPYTYCWSPALIPKPQDWAQHISISGFYFLSLAQNYKPDPELAAFLAAGEAPVYIGFGSIVVDDPNAMTEMIFEAVKKTGKRALVSKGWGGLGADELGIPEGVFMLGNVPHDWLFKHVSAVVHHGGAGTTAAGIAAGRPTVVVPFFGDQPFWGAMTAKAGAGPPPIPYKDLTADKLAEQILIALKPESLERAQELSRKISEEQGGQKGAQYFHQQLRVDDLRCSVAPNKPAAWRVKRTQVRLSAMAATILAQEGEINFSELKLFRPREFETDDGPWDPITGGATAIIGTMTTMMMGVADFPIETLKLLNIHPDTQKKEKKDKKGKKAVGGSEGASASTDSLRTSRSAEPRPNTNTTASSTSTGIDTPTTAMTDVNPGSPRKSSSSELQRIGSPGSPGNLTPRGTFMAQAMRASTQVSHSRSRSRDRSECNVREKFAHGRSKSHTLSDTKSESAFSEKLSTITPETAAHTGKGLSRIVGAGFKSPMEFSLNVAKGFHNVPKLYGDDVRQVDRVTDAQSGMRIAAKELGLGFYEGITGLVMDPYRGAKKEGALGFVKGVGKGIAGVPLKVMGGVFSVPAYAMKGLYQEALKDKGANVQNYIIAARISQGYDEASVLTPAQRQDIISRWRCLKLNIKKKKNPGEEQVEHLHAFVKERRAKRQERWARFKNKSKQPPDTRPAITPTLSNNSSYVDIPAQQPQVSAQSVSSTSSFHPTLVHAATYPRPHEQAFLSEQQLQQQADANAELEARELETAIQASVAETSRGNPEEDEMIARAIRASMNELQREPTGASEEGEENMLQRALTASIEEAQKSGATEEEQRMLEETLKNSILDTHRRRKAHGSDSEWDSSDTEDDDEYQRIIAESKELHHLHQNFDPKEYDSTVGAEAGNEEESLKKALEESQKQEEQRKLELEKQKTEEEIVLEYVKKQSLAEEEHRRQMLQGRPEFGATGGEGSGSGTGKGKGAA